MPLDVERIYGFRPSAALTHEAVKAKGAFFTGALLANKVAKLVKPRKTDEFVIADPCCGSGNLLTSVLLHLLKNEREMPRLKVYGGDVVEQFLEEGRKNLGLVHSLIDNARKGWSLEYELRNEDVFDNPEYLRSVDCLVLNPPYGKTVLTGDVGWARGSVQTAALVTMKIVDSMPPNAQIIAILPDVLRGGTRYREWRSMLSNKLKWKKEIVYGRFDKGVDVDVYLLVGRKRKCPPRKEGMLLPQYPVLRSQNTVKDYFDVRIGSVVPYRAKPAVEKVLYVDVGLAEPFGGLRAKAESRFHGVSVSAPFVVVRRTTSPSDKARLIPTLIPGKEKYVVENHLIILKPKSNTLDACREFMKRAQDKKFDLVLNSINRCRHLTKSQVENLPW